MFRNGPKLKLKQLLKKNNFFELLRFVLENAYFTFCDKIYKQERGIAMGSSLGPVIANLYMDSLLKNYKIIFPYDVPFLYKYVDYTITALPEEKIYTTLDCLNKLDEYIQFTAEVEVEMSINFLDMKLMRNNDRIITRWTRKSIKSGRILNYFSNHPLIHKRNIIYNMIGRADKLTDELYKNTCFNQIRTILKENSYPGYFVDKVFKLYIGKRRSQDNPLSVSLKVPPDKNIAMERENKMIYRSLTYIPGLSERIKSLFKKTSSDLVVSYKPRNTLSYIYNNKTPTPFLYNSNLIYKIDCGSCELSYVGMTRQYLNRRVSQHKTNVNNNDTHIALAAHSSETGHIFNFDSVSILAFENNLFKRQILESIHIFLNKTVNFKKDFNSTVLLYRNII